MSKAGIVREAERVKKPKAKKAAQPGDKKGTRKTKIAISLTAFRKPFYTGDAKMFVDLLERCCQNYGMSYEIASYDQEDKPLEKRTGKGQS